MRRTRSIAGLLALSSLLAASAVAAAESSAAPHPAAALVKDAIGAGRSKPDDALRLAHGALGLIAAQPDADLEIRARLALCDYYSERDLDRGRDMLACAIAQLPLARRGGLRGVQGDYAQAQQYFEQPSAVQLAAGLQREAVITLYNLGRNRVHAGRLELMAQAADA